MGWFERDGFTWNYPQKAVQMYPNVGFYCNFSVKPMIGTLIFHIKKQVMNSCLAHFCCESIQFRAVDMIFRDINSWFGNSVILQFAQTICSWCLHEFGPTSHVPFRWLHFWFLNLGMALMTEKLMSKKHGMVKHPIDIDVPACCSPTYLNLSVDEYPFVSPISVHL